MDVNTFSITILDLRHHSLSKWLPLGVVAANAVLNHVPGGYFWWLGEAVSPFLPFVDDCDDPASEQRMPVHDLRVLLGLLDSRDWNLCSI